MSKIILAGACRTAIGKFGGTLAGTPAVELGAIVIAESLKRAGLQPSDVDQVLMGCVLQAGLGQNVSRQATIQAGIPVETPAMTINNVCGSGLTAVNLASAMIAAGEAEIVVAGGMENMSASPYALPQARFGYRMNNGSLVDVMVNDGLWDSFNHYHMGMTAENVAEQYGITRAEQDAFAALSQQKCEAAQAAGKFAEEIVPVPIKVKKEIIPFLVDEYPRQGVTIESLAKLSSAFKPDGTVTAANASGINDGAACVIVMSEEKAKLLGVKPLARLVSSASAGVDPSIMGVGPIESTRKALSKAELSIADIDLFEANEAFSAQCIAVGKKLGIPEEKLNVNGGAIALGHPIGASGCRILVSLLYEMNRQNAKRGLATLCVGGGMGVTTIVERI